MLHALWVISVYQSNNQANRLVAALRRHAVAIEARELLTVTVSADGGAIYMDYDTLGRLISYTDADNGVTKTDTITQTSAGLPGVAGPRPTVEEVRIDAGKRGLEQGLSVADAARDAGCRAGAARIRGGCRRCRSGTGRAAA